MLNIFKKKVNKHSQETDELMIKAMGEHLDLIRGLQNTMSGLLDNDAVVMNAVVQQREAIKDLQEEIERLQKLVERTRES